jgi:hypothetical protein
VTNGASATEPRENEREGGEESNCLFKPGIVTLAFAVSLAKISDTLGLAHMGNHKPNMQFFLPVRIISGLV